LHGALYCIGQLVFDLIRVQFQAVMWASTKLLPNYNRPCGLYPNFHWWLSISCHYNKSGFFKMSNLTPFPFCSKIWPIWLPWLLKWNVFFSNSIEKMILFIINIEGGHLMWFLWPMCVRQLFGGEWGGGIRFWICIFPHPIVI